MDWTWLIPAIPVLLAALSWCISNHHANEREKRKELRSEIDTIEKIAKSITEKLGKYHSLYERNNESIQLALEIRILFQEMALKFERIGKRTYLRKQDDLYEQCYIEHEALFDQATNAYFDTSDTLPSEQYTEQIQAINIHAQQFIESLHKLFLKYFDKIG